MHADEPGRNSMRNQHLVSEQGLQFFVHAGGKGGHNEYRLTCDRSSRTAKRWFSPIHGRLSSLSCMSRRYLALEATSRGAVYRCNRRPFRRPAWHRSRPETCCLRISENRCRRRVLPRTGIWRDYPSSACKAPAPWPVAQLFRRSSPTSVNQTCRDLSCYVF